MRKITFGFVILGLLSMTMFQGGVLAFALIALFAAWVVILRQAMLIKKEDPAKDLTLTFLRGNSLYLEETARQRAAYEEAVVRA